MNWHARMILPYKKGSNGIGHYDLQLVGKYTFDGIAYINPVFSYAREGSTGYLALFDRSISAAVYKEYLPFKGYSYSDKCSSSDAQYQAFLDLVTSSINANSKQAVDVTDANGKKVGKYYRYSIATPYKNYDMTTHNCFKAVGLWVKALGDSSLADFAEEHSYTDYTAYPMVQNHSSLWNFTGTYT